MKIAPRSDRMNEVILGAHRRDPQVGRGAVDTLRNRERAMRGSHAGEEGGRLGSPRFKRGHGAEPEDPAQNQLEAHRIEGAHHPEPRKLELVPEDGVPVAPAIPTRTRGPAIPKRLEGPVLEIEQGVRVV